MLSSAAVEKAPRHMQLEYITGFTAKHSGCEWKVLLLIMD